ncbi:biotin/lipoate A/B protein ligase family protein [Calditrichota bacterium]
MVQKLNIHLYDFDEDLLTAAKESGELQIRIYSVDNRFVVLGRGSKPEVELNLENCLNEEVQIYQRRGGGCSVLLDPGNVIVSVATPAPGFGENPRYFDAISRWLIEGLTSLGFEGVVRRGISDLCIGDRKIGGSCIYRTKGLLYYTTTLLVHPDVQAMERFLKHPPREPKYRANREHSDFVIALDQVQTELITSDLIESLQNTLNSEDLTHSIQDALNPH